MFRAVAVGGTFDHIHRGHRAILSRAFESGERVLIGVVTDRFAQTLGKNAVNPYSVRVERLKAYLDATYPDREFHIVPLDDYFTPEIYAEDVEAIVVSPETAERINDANKVRSARGLKPLKAVVVDMILADDGARISSSRIRRGEIDEEGHIITHF